MYSKHVQSYNVLFTKMIHVFIPIDAAARGKPKGLQYFFHEENVREIWGLYKINQ